MEKALSRGLWRFTYGIPCFNPLLVQPSVLFPVVIEHGPDYVVVLVHAKLHKHNGRRVGMQFPVLARRNGNDDEGIVDLRGVVQSPQ